jgi:FAD:protein FMN transferase
MSRAVVSTGAACAMTLLVLAALNCGCARGRDPVRAQGLAMGTFTTLAVPRADAARLAEAAAVLRETFETLEAALSVYRPESDLARVNRAAGDAPVPIAPLTRAAVTAAMHYAEQTGGAFDPTVGPLLELWGFRGGAAPEHVPPPAARTAALDRVGVAGVRLDGNTLGLAAAGMALDLGGVAKGWAVDRAYTALQALDLSGFMLNLGGNIRVAGEAAPGRPWTVGIRDPFQADRLLGTLRLADGMAVATSGHYERFVEIDGVRYAHIMDPRTGFPVRGMAGVTVMARTAADADALSTALFVAGMESGAALLTRFSGAHAVFVPDARPARALPTPGFPGLVLAPGVCAP